MPSSLFLLFVLAFAFPSPFLYAVEITDEEGKTYQGEVLDGSGESLYLDTPQGIINLSKSKIKTWDGRPYQKEAGDVSPRANSEPPAAEFAANWAIQVGPGGLTQEELTPYQRGLSRADRHKKLSGESWGTSSDEVRSAIEDEMVFQEALREGLHMRGTIRDSIIQLYQANQTTGAIHPDLFSESDMKSFYEKNLKEFMFPAEYVFSFFDIGGTQEEIQSAYEKAKSNPGDQAGWKKGGWHKQGDSFYLPLTAPQEEIIYNLRKGEMSPPLYAGGSFGAFVEGDAYFFRCLDYKPPVQKTFEQAKDRVKHLMIREQQKIKTAQLHGRLQGTSLFEEALKAGTHRDRSVRVEIINTYLQTRRKTLAQAVKAVKERYPVKIFAENVPLEAAAQNTETATADLAANESGEWAVSGKLIDLVSLKPIFPAELLFSTDDQEKKVEVKVGSGGLFSAQLPAAGGKIFYRIKILAPPKGYDTIIYVLQKRSFASVAYPERLKLREAIPFWNETHVRGNAGRVEIGLFPLKRSAQEMADYERLVLGIDATKPQ